jgi:hypothetical protein
MEMRITSVDRKMKATGTGDSNMKKGIQRESRLKGADDKS